LKIGSTWSIPSEVFALAILVLMPEPSILMLISQAVDSVHDHLQILLCLLAAYAVLSDVKPPAGRPRPTTHKSECKHHGIIVALIAQTMRPASMAEAS